MPLTDEDIWHFRHNDSHDVMKEDPEKRLLRGERAYMRHPFEGTVEQSTTKLPKR